MNTKLDPVKKVAELVKQNDYAYLRTAYSDCHVTNALMDHLNVNAIELTLVSHGCKEDKQTYIVNEEQEKEIEKIVNESKKDK